MWIGTPSPSHRSTCTLDHDVPSQSRQRLTDNNYTDAQATVTFIYHGLSTHLLEEQLPEGTTFDFLGVFLLFPPLLSLPPPLSLGGEPLLPSPDGQRSRLDLQRER